MRCRKELKQGKREGGWIDLMGFEREGMKGGDGKRINGEAKRDRLGGKRKEMGELGQG